MDALGATNLGMRFKDHFDESVAAKGLPNVDWGSGLWQRILGVYGVRKKFVHVVPSIARDSLMTPVVEAETAVEVLREGIKAVSLMVGPRCPPWADDDGDSGWRGL